MLSHARFLHVRSRATYLCSDCAVSDTDEDEPEDEPEPPFNEFHYKYDSDEASQLRSGNEHVYFDDSD